MTSSAPLVRHAARLLVVDPQQRVLLFEERDPDNPQSSSWWITPGGGLEAGESFEAAARRELLEETGLRAELAGPVHHHQFEMTYQRRPTRQIEKYFLVRVPTEPRLDFARLTALERRTMVGAAWWRPDALRRSEAMYFPRRLDQILDRVLRSGTTASPR